MKILVTVKRVTDYTVKPKINASADNIDLTGVNYVVNPFDEIAVEEALRLATTNNGEVVTVTVGPKEASQQIRSVLAMGANRGIHIITEGYENNLDPSAIARIIQKVVEQEKPDLIITGKLATDDESGIVGQLLAGYLDYPQITFVSKEANLESEEEKAQKPGILIEGKKVTAFREVDGGLEVLQFEMPGIITAELRLNLPRYASLPNIMKAKKKEIKEILVNTLGIDLTPKLKVLQMSTPPKRSAGKILPDVPALVSQLASAKVL